MKLKSAIGAVVLLVTTNIVCAQQNTLPANGNVGVGLSDPISPIHVRRNNLTVEYPSVASRGNVMQVFQADNNALEIGLASGINSRRAWILARHFTVGAYGEHYATLHLQPRLDNPSRYRGVAIGYSPSTQLPVGVGLVVNGNVGIGTIDPKAKLSVEGAILAKEIKVKTDITVPDYVFESDYDLMSLRAVENYIIENKHLPEIPSAKDIEKTGLDLAEMNLLLLKKVEELTLHLIDKDKRIQDLSDKLDRVVAEVDVLKNK